MSMDLRSAPKQAEIFGRVAPMLRFMETFIQDKKAQPFLDEIGIECIFTWFWNAILAFDCVANLQLTDIQGSTQKILLSKSKKIGINTCLT